MRKEEDDDDDDDDEDDEGEDEGEEFVDARERENGAVRDLQDDKLPYVTARWRSLGKNTPPPAESPLSCEKAKSEGEK